MKDINIYIIRHAESVANANRPQIIGQNNDAELTINGVEQATKLGHRLSDEFIPDFVASSPYKRAFDTARIVCDLAEWETPIHKFDELREYDPGKWKGKDRDAVLSNVDNLKGMYYHQMKFSFPEGESYYGVERRMADWFDKAFLSNKEVLTKAQEKEYNAVVFSHGQSIKCLLHFIMGFSESFLWKIRISNTGICHITLNHKGLFLNTMNDTAHLFGTSI